MNNQLKSLILADLRTNVPQRTIAFDRGVPVELVGQVREAYRAVLVMRAQGFNPQLIYANFGDLLTASVCGIEKRRAG